MDKYQLPLPTPKKIQKRNSMGKTLQESHQKTEVSDISHRLYSPSSRLCCFILPIIQRTCAASMHGYSGLHHAKGHISTVRRNPSFPLERIISKASLVRWFGPYTEFPLIQTLGCPRVLSYEIFIWYHSYGCKCLDISIDRNWLTDFQVAEHLELLNLHPRKYAKDSPDLAQMV